MLQDLRFAFRTLRRTPGFTATAGLTLALGIGATSLMFSVVNAVLLRPLPYPEQSRLMLVFNQRTNTPSANTIRLTPLDFDDYRSRAHSFESLAGYVGKGFTLSGASEPELVIGEMVTPQFFRTLGVAPALGRVFAPNEFQLGHENVVVLSDRLWKRRFGSDPNSIGSRITLDGKPFTIAGVMPPSFEYPASRYELWTPLPSPRTAELPPMNRVSHYLEVIGRLKPAASVEQAQHEVATIASALASEYSDSNSNMSARVTPLEQFLVRDVERPLRILFAAVGLVVLIACANVTNLLLARASVRSREVAIRQALGAARWRLVRQFLVETVVLYVVGACGALAVASWGIPLLLSFAPQDIPHLGDTSLDLRVLVATMLMSLACALIFGLAPAYHGGKVDPAQALRGGGRTASAARAGQRVRVALVVSELALSVVLLIGAGLMLRSLVRLTTVDPGFDADGQLTFSVVMTPRTYPDESSMLSFSERLSSQLAAVPGIQHAGFTTHLPLSGQNLENGFEVDGYVPANADAVPIAGMRGVSDDYFAALGTRLKAGRVFTAIDRSDSQPVAIVNEAFARRYFGGSNPIGRRLREGGYPNWRVVVGVISDVKHSGPAAEARPEVSLPYSQLTFGFLNAWARGIYVVVRGEMPAVSLATSARAVIRSMDPDMSMNQPRALADYASEAISQPRFRTILLSGFAAVAIALASVGIFGVLSYFVTQRTREIGIRMALGAASGDILRMVVGRGLLVTAMGLAIGIIAAIPLTRSLETLLFEVKPLDAPTIATVIAGLALVAGLASYLPARRALRIAPITALQIE
jgi:putative ABC transport system permease protein